MQRLVLLWLIVAAVPGAQCRRSKVKENMLSSEQEGADLALDQDESSDTTGTKGKCPRFEPSIGDKGVALPSLVLITIKSAQHLSGYRFFSLNKVDPYVEFYMGEEGEKNIWMKKYLDIGHVDEKYWRARTPTLWNNKDPTWEWSCMLAYDNSIPENKTAQRGSIFNAKIMDSNVVTTNKFVASASGDILAMLRAEDQRGDGEIDVQLALKDKEGNAIIVNDKAALLHIKLQVVREQTMYSVIRGAGQAVVPGMSGAGGDANGKPVW